MTGSARVLLGIAAGVVAVESMVYVGAGAFKLSGGLFGLGFGVGILFLVYGLGQLYAAWRLRQGMAWARAPLVVTQLIQILLAQDVRPEGLPWVAPTLIVSALVVLGCLFAPPVTQALIRDRSV